MRNAKKIGIDITGLKHAVKLTGIQRVELELIKHLSRLLDATKYEVVPVYTAKGAQSEMVLEPLIAPDEIFAKPLCDISDCHIIFPAFLNTSLPFKKIRELKTLNNIKVIPIIHDILLIKNPEWFSTPHKTSGSISEFQSKRVFQLYLQMMLTTADIVIVPSKQVKKDIEKLDWNYQAEVKVIHLGAYEEPQQKKFVRENEQFNCVYLSTIEPRKAHHQLLQAFDILWARGVDIKLNIIGNQGWLVDELIDLIRGHREFNKRLVWHKGLSDREVNQIYEECHLAFAVSHDEGFGLNIEEALVQGLRVIARDIPVFRERNYENLFFFNGDTEALSRKIIEVLELPYDDSVMSAVRTFENFTEEVIDLVKLI